MPGCLFVSSYVKTAEPIRPKFDVGPHVTPGKVYEWSKFQKFVFKSFMFLQNFENAQKNIMKSQTFFVLFVILYKEKMLTDKATIKSLNRRLERSTLKP